MNSDEATIEFDEKMDEHLRNVAELGEAVKSAKTVGDAIDNLEATRLLRQLSDDEKEN